MAKEEEWHYCNIFERKNGKYHGANFRFITDKGPNFKSTINESKVYTFHKHPEDFYMMYLRPK
jgi:hypothetical protein